MDEAVSRRVMKRDSTPTPSKELELRRKQEDQIKGRSRAQMVANMELSILVSG